MKIDKIIELSQSSDLPKDGWIQSCLTCGTKTARIHDYKIEEHTLYRFIFKAFLCPECKKKINTSAFKEKFNNKCEKKIKKINYTYVTLENELNIPVDSENIKLMTNVSF